MLKIKELAIMQANNELDAGLKAIKLGNQGKARVCARRACAAIIDFWLKDHKEFKWGNHAIGFLEGIRDENSLPENIRRAAERLTAKVDKNFSTGYNENPLDDAKLIIEFFLNFYKQ